jgi:hypothetical protein
LIKVRLRDPVIDVKCPMLDKVRWFTYGATRKIQQEGLPIVTESLHRVRFQRPQTNIWTYWEEMRIRRKFNIETSLERLETCRIIKVEIRVAEENRLPKHDLILFPLGWLSI